jgi:hypothetical protein
MEVNTTAWLLGRTDFNIASVRYRAVYPAMALTGEQHRHLFFDSHKVLINQLDQIDRIVIVKRTDSAMIDLAACAKDCGINLYMDICDDILSEAYRPQRSELNRMTLKGLVTVLDGIVTTGESLKRILMGHGVSETLISIVPDVLETKDLQSAGRDFFEARIVKNSATVRNHIAETFDKVVAMHKRLKTPPFDIPSRLVNLAGHGARLKATKAAARVSEIEPRQIISPSRLSDADHDKRNKWQARSHKIVWFGNAGTPNSESGMLTLLRAVEPLRRLAEDFNFVLHVVSNDVVKYKAFAGKIGVKTKYLEWSPEVQEEAFHEATASLLTVGQDSFSSAKSANRAILSLSRNVPVVAQYLESMEPLRPVIQMEGIEAGLRRYMSDPEAGRFDVERARNLVLEAYSLGQLTPLWAQALDMNASSAAVIKRPRCDGRAPKLLVVIDLIQDIYLMIPIVARAQSEGMDVGVITSERAMRSTQKLFDSLIDMNIVPTIIRSSNLKNTDYRWLRDATDVITAVETNQNVHKTAHYITRMARERGLATYTLQHGFENIGLTYQDPELEDVEFASETLLLWQDPNYLPEWVSASVRARGIGVGRVVPDLPPAQPSKRRDFPLRSDKPIIGVFENLHWARFTEAYRQEFIESLVHSVNRFPQFQFLLKPHPAGKWVLRDETAQARLAPLLERGNDGGLVIASPIDIAWEGWPGAAVMPHLALAITTPSSIILDAAEHRTPIAIHQGDLDALPLYEPVTALTDRRDWAAMLSLDQTHWSGMSDYAKDLKLRTIKTGDAVERILNLIKSGER